MHSRASVAGAMIHGGPDVRVKYGHGGDPDNPLSLRRLRADIIEKYARHVGHADLIR